MSSVLETFMILFQTDAQEASEQVGDLDESLDNVEETSNRSTRAADAAGQALVNMGQSALKAVVGMLAIKKVVEAFKNKALELDRINKFSQMVGESAVEVGVWEEAIKRSGGTGEEFRSTLAGLNEKLVDASMKGFNEVVPFFNQLGISIIDANGKAKTSLQIFPELASSFERMSKQQSQAFGKKLGLDSATILLLQSGRKEVEKLLERQREYGTVSEEATALSGKFNDHMADLKQVAGFAGQGLMLAFLPAVNAVVSALVEAGDAINDGVVIAVDFLKRTFSDFSQWIKQNQGLIFGFFTGVAAVIMWKTLPAIGALAASFVSLGVTVASTATFSMSMFIPYLVAITSMMWGLAASVWATIAPFIGIGAAVIAVGAFFALLGDDLWAFANDQDSIIGEIVKSWDEVVAYFSGLVDSISNFFGKIHDSISSAFGTENVELFGKILMAVITAPFDAIKKLKGGLESIWAYFGGDDEKDINANIKKSIEEVRAVDVGDISPAQESLRLASRSPIASMTSQSIATSQINKSNRSVTVQTGDIKIETQATDADGIASTVSDSMSKQLRTAVENFDDGMMA